MTQYIEYDRQLPLGSDVARFVNKLMDVLADGRRLKGKLDAVSYGSDFVTLAAKLGLPNPGQVSDSQAQDLWTLVSTALSTMDVPAVQQLSRLDQG